MNQPTQPGRRAVILGGAAIVGAAALPRAAQAGLASANDLLGATRTFASTLEPDKLKAASFAWNGSEWRNWNYFGVAGYIKPGLRLEQMSAAQKDAAWDVLAAVWSPDGVTKGEERHAAAGHPGGERQRRGPALVGAVLDLGVRHAGRDGRLGLALRGPSPDAVGRGARQPDRVGDAVLVLGAAQPRHVRQACRAQHAEGRGGPGAAAVGAIFRRSAAQGAYRRTRRPTTFSLTPAASAPTPRRSALPPPS